MSTTYPAMRGKMGTTEYWVVVIPAKELTEKVCIPSEMDGWEDETVDERYQRKINYSRVEKSIAPYLATDPARFFGSLIVTVTNPEKIIWESINEIAQKIPANYKQNGHEIGFLTLSGQEILVPLDGQHRLAALKFAITGKNQKDDPIVGLLPSTDLAKDLITVMLVKHEKHLARKIFNKVNRYARPTSKADNLITSDDDILAILARKQADVIGSRLVNTSSNSLSDTSECFTTLSTIYGILGTVLSAHPIDLTKLPETHVQNLLTLEADKFFTSFLGEVTDIKKALLNPDADGDEKRAELRGKLLILKPFGLWVAATVVHELTIRGTKTGKISVKDACLLLNKIDWKRENPEWQSVMLHGDKIVSGDTARKHASKIIARKLGAKFDSSELEEIDELKRQAASPSSSARRRPKKSK